MNQLKQKCRTWGFQFSRTDAVVIGFFVSSALFFEHFDNPLWWLLVIVAAHFFLFCNVFRVRRFFELWWAGIFIANAGLWLMFEKLVWTNVLACQFPVTAAFILTEMRTAYYHGVFARKINPRLTDYLEYRSDIGERNK